MSNYGGTYGYTNQYGAGAAPDSWHQGGGDPDAKQDTGFLGKSNTGTLSELAVDRSQWETDMTESGAALVQSSPGSQFVMGSEWSLEFLLDMDEDTSGLLAEFTFSGGWIRFGLGTSGGVIEIARPDTTLIMNETNDIVSGTTNRVAIGFAATPHRDTTGASDAIRIYAYVQNYDTGAYRIFTIETATIATITRVDFFDSAAPAFTGGTCVAVRFSHAFHTPTELREDFDARTPAAARTSETRAELLTPEKTNFMGDDGQFAGPVQSIVAAGIRQQDLRLAGPVINEAYELTSHSYTAASTPPFAPAKLWRLAPGVTTRWIGIQYLVWRPVPRPCNAVRVRVHLDIDDDTITGSVACYSMSERPLSLRLGGGKVGTGGLFVHEVASTSLTMVPGTTEAWFDLGDLEIARDRNGLGSYFALGFVSTIDVGIGVLAWTADPIVT